MVWNREGVFDLDVYDLLFKEAEKRGQDGFGISVLNKHGKQMSGGTISDTETYSKVRDRVLKDLKPNLEVGTIVIANFRAQPSTEVKSSMSNLQPIVLVDQGLIVAHNGTVADFIVKDYKYRMKTEIDSEVIPLMYLDKGRNIKDTVEELVGGLAFVMFDDKLSRLYVVCDYKPIAVGYIRGKGFIAHSSENAIAKVVEKVYGGSRCGMNIWEDYYYHWQNGYTIREIDIDSGVEREYGFRPRFVTPVFDSSKKGKGEKIFVVASGGIDSGLTAFVLKKLGYDVELLHFDYGQKGEEAERFAVKKLSMVLECEHRLVNLNLCYRDETNSALIRGDVELRTGTSDFIKTTDAWVENRNQLFLSIAATQAEMEIIRNNLEKVYIVGGYAQLEEEGIYPDNSERFVRSFFENVKYSSIVGHRIDFVNVMQDIMKYEEWVLGAKLDFPFEYTCSCDTPQLVIDEKGEHIELCNQCGSTLLSKWAAEQAGVKDPRTFYNRPIKYKMREKKFEGKIREIDVRDIVRRLRLPKESDNQKLESLIK